MTSTRTIVEAVGALLENNQTGIFNVANDGYASMYKLAEYCGLIDDTKFDMQMGVLRGIQKIYLVNNIMNLDKLKQFYMPRPLELEAKTCYNILYEKSNL